MRPYSASVRVIKKEAKVLSKQEKIQLSKAQEAVALKLMEKPFAEVIMHANGEERRHLDDRRALLHEVMEHVQESSVSDKNGYTFKFGSPFSRIDDEGDLAVSAYSASGQRVFTVLVCASSPNDEWRIEVPQSKLDAFYECDFNTISGHSCICIAPAYRVIVQELPLWQWMLRSALTPDVSFDYHMDIETLGPLYVYGHMPTFDLPESEFIAMNRVRDKNVTVNPKGQILGYAPTISKRKSDAAGYFQEALCWIDDMTGNIFSASARIFDGFLINEEILEAIAYIKLRQVLQSGKAIPEQELVKRQRAFWRQDVGGATDYYQQEAQEVTEY